MCVCGGGEMKDEEEENELRRMRALRTGTGSSGRKEEADEEAGVSHARGERNEQDVNVIKRPMARKFELDFNDVPSKRFAATSGGIMDAMMERSMLPSSFGLVHGDGPAKEELQGDDRDEDVFGPPRPPAFTSRHDNEDNGDEDQQRERDGKDEQKEEQEEDGGSVMDEWSHLPIHRECRLQGHSRAVSCVDVEHSGSRVASGGHDGKVLFYDFGGMKSDLRAFRSVTPSGAHHIRAVSWSPSGELLLVVPSSACASILSRDGATRGEFIKGDMYIRDMKNTKGHVAGLTGGQWSRNDRSKLATCAEDASVRIWDASNFGSQLSVLKATKVSAAMGNSKQSVVECCSWSGDDRLIAGGMRDGSVQIWDAGASRSAAIGVVGAPRQQMVKRQDWSFAPSAKTVIRKAFVPAHRNAGAGAGGGAAAGLFDDDVAVTGVSWYNSTIVAARSLNGSVKVWDIRMNAQTPLAANENLPLSAGSANIDSATICFSPDGTLLLTPTILMPDVHLNRDAHGGGARALSLPRQPEVALAFLDRTTLEVVRHVGYGGAVDATGTTGADTTISCSCWNPNINQIFVGGGSVSRAESNTTGAMPSATKMRYEGFTSILFSNEFSSRGALLSTGRAAKTRDISDLALIANFQNNMTKSVRVHERPTHVNRRKVGGDQSAGGQTSLVKRRKLDAAIPQKQSLSGRGTHGRAGATSTTLLKMKMFGKKDTKS